MAATQKPTVFQQIAVPRLRLGAVVGASVAGVIALVADPANTNSILIFGSGTLLGSMIGFIAACMTPEGSWKLSHPH
jgi:hypothetical protein